MRISQVRISNVLGVRELDFKAGLFNTIEGPNGSGKTSVLEAIKSVVEGGTDATLLRHGEEKGEIVLVLDDGTKIRKRVTAKSQPVTVERNGVRADKPQETLKTLTDAFAVNPVRFLQAKSKARLDTLLECLNIPADGDRLSQIVGSPITLKEGVSALDQVDAVFDAVYAERTVTNRAITQKEATISQLAATLPDSEGPADESYDEPALIRRLENLAAEEAAEMSRIEEKLGGLRKAHDADIGAIRDEVAALQAQIAEKQGLIATKTQTFADTERRASQQREISTKRFADTRAPINESLAVIRRDRDAHAKAGQTRQVIATMRAEADALIEDRDRQAAALTKLQAYKSELLASIPIEGLEVRDGEILRSGIPFDRLNTQQQVEIAVEIANLRSGELGFVCVDGIELLDTEHFEAFRDRWVASGRQLFTTRVTDGEFAVSAHS